MAVLTPKLRAKSLVPSSPPFRGNKAASKAYPGKKSTIGKPRIIRRTLFGKNAIIKMSINVPIFMPQSTCLVLSSHNASISTNETSSHDTGFLIILQ